MTTTAVEQVWPIAYTPVFQERQERFRKIASTGSEVGALAFYGQNPVAFIQHWCVTYDPRNAGKETPTLMPFILFPKQIELVDFLYGLLKDQESGLVEKSRDMGATWVCAAFSVWLWLFYPGAAVGWGSRKEQLVDRIGDPDSIFEKIRIIIRYLPKFFIPAGFDQNSHCTYMKCINPANDATITGEAGDNIGRGGRKLIYFKDESAHYGNAELIEAALGDNTNVQVDISSVWGTGNLFYRRRHSGLTRIFIMDWRDHPGKTQEWYDKRKAKSEAEGVGHVFAQEVDRDYTAAVEGILIPQKLINAAIDAHKRLGFKPTGEKRLALDPADEGGDASAMAFIHGPVVLHLEQWHEGDTNFSSEKAYNYATEHGATKFVYDSIGVGAGVKAQCRRLARNDESSAGKRMSIAGFNAGSREIINPDREWVEGKKNKDMFYNQKAQAWWALLSRFEKTYRAVELGEKYDPEELISLPSDLPLLHDLKLELSRPKRDTDDSGKVKVESKKAMKSRGVQSPNLADALVMCYAPIKLTRIHIG